MKRFVCAVIAMIGLGGAATPAVAAPIRFNFTGTVTQVTADPEGPIPGNPTFGSPFSGLYVFDSDAVDAIAAPGSGSYTSPAATQFLIAVEIGGVTSATNGFFNIGVVDGASSDFYSVLACGNPACSTFLLELLFQDVDGTVFASDALPLDAPPLSAFEVAGFTLRSSSGGREIEILGQVTSLTCVDGCVVTDPAPDPALVPEPSTMVLCGTGLLASVFRRRRSSIQ